MSGDFESEHHPPPRVDSVQFEATALHPVPNPPNPISKTLAKLVGHLWRGAAARSFAEVVRADPAPTVGVMQRGNRGGGGGGRRGGYGPNRGGFGGPKGGGRDDPKFHTWKRREDGGSKAKDEPEKKVDGDPQGMPCQEQAQDNSKWEGQKGTQEQQTWGPKPGVVGKDAASGEGNLNPTTPNPYHPARNAPRVPCDHCGMLYHLSKDCRKNACEICGLNNHFTYECKRCVPWHFGPELCAAQVENQSFFYIDECLDPRVAKENACTVVISVMSGSVNPKQIELEFMNLIGADSWRWQAKVVADGKFRLRFPTAKMASEWSRIRFLTLKNDAKIMIESWAPSVGIKGVLQSSWFTVGRIPDDQRSIRTLAKVGGLVGKVLEIDEETRFRYDYVRMRIACRDVTRVPRTAEGALGMYVIDFEFEREVPGEGAERVLKSGIKVIDDQ